MNPNYPHQFLYLRAIQGRSGSTINPQLQDNLLLPEGLTENIYHVENGKELRSIVNHGLIRGGVSLRTVRQAVFPWIIKMAEEKPYRQKPCHTKTRGNAFRTQYFGAM